MEHQVYVFSSIYGNSAPDNKQTVRWRKFGPVCIDSSAVVGLRSWLRTKGTCSAVSPPLIPRNNQQPKPQQTGKPRPVTRSDYVQEV